MAAPSIARHAMYWNDEMHCYYSTPTAGCVYVEESERTRFYRPTPKALNPRAEDWATTSVYRMPTALYRLFDASGLLYIGIAVHPHRRWAEHTSERSWWPTVSVKTVDWYADRGLAVIAEYEAIRDEDPRHNRDRRPPVIRKWWGSAAPSGPYSG